jgi:hypothetical protein
MVKPTLVVTRPAETGILVRALAECFQAATAVLTESTQPTANLVSESQGRSLDTSQEPLDTIGFGVHRTFMASAPPITVGN